MRARSAQFTVVMAPWGGFRWGCRHGHGQYKVHSIPRTRPGIPVGMEGHPRHFLQAHQQAGVSLLCRIPTCLFFYYHIRGRVHRDMGLCAIYILAACMWITTRIPESECHIHMAPCTYGYQTQIPHRGGGSHQPTGAQVILEVI